MVPESFLSVWYAFSEVTCYNTLLPDVDRGPRHIIWDNRCLSRWRFHDDAAMLMGGNIVGNPECKLVSLPPLPPGISEIPNEVNILATKEWHITYGKSPANMAIIAEALREAYSTTLTTYHSLGIQVSSYMDLLLTTTPPGKGTLMTNRDGCACLTIAREDFTTDLLSLDPIIARVTRQQLAHEIYHCEQYIWRKQLSLNWIIEGVADYFSNVAFPATDNEWRYDTKEEEKMYNPLLPIYNQESFERGYATNIFFQSLEMAHGARYVDEFVKLMPEDKEGEPPKPFIAAKERNRLSQIPGFIDDLHRFAKLYTIVDPPRHIAGATSGSIVKTRIVDTCAATNTCTNGIYRQIGNVPNTWPTEITPSPKNTYKLQVTPFTVRHFIIDAANLEGSRLSISSSATGSNQRVAFRLNSQTTWTDLPGSIDLPCPTKDAPQLKILFLFTSTQDLELAEIEIAITIVNEKRDEPSGTSSNKCEEKPPTATNTTLPLNEVCGSTGGPVDACLLGHTWVADNPRMEAFLNKIGSTSSYGTSAGIKVTGRQTLSFDETTSRFKMSYIDAANEYFVSKLGLDIASKGIINGWHTGTFVQKSSESGKSTICMAVDSGSGSVKTIVQVGKTVEPPIVTSLDVPGPGNITATSYSYLCNDTALVLEISGRGIVADMLYRP